MRIRGDVDIAVVPDMQAALETVIESGLINIVLDLSSVNYADSSALGMLVWLDHQLGGLGGKVVLAGVSQNVSRVLEISGLTAVAPVVCTQDTVEAALHSMDVVAEAGEPIWIERLTMLADVEGLAPIRERVCSLLSDVDFPDTALFDIKVALGEALANAIRHGSPEGTASEIDIVIRAYEDRVAIDVIDSGSGFSGDHVCSDDLYASGGRGIMFMRALMDRVVFSPGPTGGTLVTLVKHRAPVEAS